MDLFSDDVRRNPYPTYELLRNKSPLLRLPPPFDAWMIFDYASVKRALTDHENFSSRVPGPRWFIFEDAPVHTKLRSLISRAFTPRMIANLEPSIRELSRTLLDDAIESRRNGRRHGFLRSARNEGDRRNDRNPAGGLVPLQAME